MAAPNTGLEGMEETQKNLEHFGFNMSSCVRTACWQLAGKILMQSKNNCRTAFTGTPSNNPEPGTPTGRLMSSLSMRASFSNQTAGLKSPAKTEDAVKQPLSSDPTVAVGTNIEYSPYPEFGTRKMHARMYMYPAFFAYEGDLPATLKDVVEKKAAMRNFKQLLPVFDSEGAWE